MSTIEEVRALGKKMQEVVEARRKLGALDPNQLDEDLKRATDEYSRAVQELKTEND